MAKAALQKKEFVDRQKSEGGGNGAEFIPGVALTGTAAGHFRDVTDISSYLGEDYRSAGVAFPDAFVERRPVRPFFAIGGGLLLLGAAAAGLAILAGKKHAAKAREKACE